MTVKSNEFVSVITFPTIPICTQDKVVYPVYYLRWV